MFFMNPFFLPLYFFIFRSGNQEPLEESHRHARPQHDVSAARGHRRHRLRHCQRQRRARMRLHSEKGDRESDS